MVRDTLYKKIILPRVISPYIVSAAANLFKKKERGQKEQRLILSDRKTLEEKGHDEYVQDQARKKESDKMKMNNLISQSNRLIMSITAFSFIPFHLYTNTINVEESRIVFLFKQPFTFQSHSVDIKDISNIFIESAFLFATLQVVSRTYIQNDIKIGYLWKKKADKIRRTIESLRTLVSANIDTSQYEKTELMDKLEELHAAQSNVTA